MEFFIAIGLIVALVLIYVLAYKKNQETDKPEGCEEISCQGCHVENCASRDL